MRRHNVFFWEEIKRSVLCMCGWWFSNWCNLMVFDVFHVMPWVFGVWKKWFAGANPIFVSIEAMSNYGTSRFLARTLWSITTRLSQWGWMSNAPGLFFFEIQAKCYLLNVNQPFEWQTCLANIKYSYCFVLKACLDWPLDATIAMLWFWTGQPWPTVRNIGWIWMPDWTMRVGKWSWWHFLGCFCQDDSGFVIGGNFICWLWFLFWRHWCFIGILARMKVETSWERNPDLF